MKKVLSIALMMMKGGYYAILSLLQKNGGLEALLKLGAMITHSKANYIALNNLKKHEDSLQLIEERYSNGIPPMEELSQYPKESVGYLFYKQMTDEGLDLFPYVDKSELSEIEYMRERRREIHDILHVVLGYDTSMKGEAALNMFLASQSGMVISYLVVVGVILKHIFKHPQELASLMNLVAEAWQRAKHSRCVFGIRWEEWLKRDVYEVRLMMELPQTAGILKYQMS